MQLLDMLLSFTDFQLFKDLMLSYKKTAEAKKPKPSEESKKDGKKTSKSSTTTSIKPKTTTNNKLEKPVSTSNIEAGNAL